ncbi:hypothetical protein CORC01_03596 [Colletotrichum orchidophilum]|uniref:Uncharacterized protein n=1 Tax=Colletotrichum orchidophilum TaxID=1209926 RepID=A0A1G4BHY8_9PEZI|nr:uncharacterized protein CORC01_03596 [Colletotrichum orchidophilum]OHF01029.1 hypothetical protein CORC01_03596 [Colletotrichum orchidophilum]
MRVRSEGGPKLPKPNTSPPHHLESHIGRDGRWDTATALHWALAIALPHASASLGWRRGRRLGVPLGAAGGHSEVLSAGNKSTTVQRTGPILASFFMLNCH